MDTKSVKLSKWPLIVVIVASFLYPAILFYLIYSLNIGGQTTNYFLTIGSAAFLAALAIWAMKKDGIILRDIGFSYKNLWQALGLLGIFWILIALFQYLTTGEISLAKGTSFPLIIQQWLFVGLAEELLVRGYLLNRLTLEFSNRLKSHARGRAIVLSSLIFATVHIPVRLFNQVPLVQIAVSMIFIFALGIYFSYLFLRTKNIIFTGLAHGSWNVPIISVQVGFIQMILILIVVQLNGLRDPS